MAARPEPVPLTTPPKEAPPPRSGGGWRRFRANSQRLVLLALVLAGAWFAITEMRERVRFVAETDARVAGELVTVSSRVSGWLTELVVREGDEVTAGQVLANIDSRESKVLLRRLEAQVNGIRAERNRLLAERELTDLQTRSRLETQLSMANAAQASLAAIDSQAEYARAERDRAESLFKKRVIARQQLDQARTEAARASNQRNAARAQFEEAKARLEEARVDRAQLNVLDQALEILVHREADLAAQRARQQLDLEDRTIRASLDGVVDRTFVEAGEYVNPGQRLMIVHDPARIWVDANIKETEVRRLKLGQDVTITVDAYPDERFSGKVDSIGSSTTASYALLPNPNPSGNFTKITQRLPVRVKLLEPNPRLRPGMMVEIEVHVARR